MNTVDIIGKTADGKIEVAVRSAGERDQHGVIEDPYAHIMTIATQMGYTLTVQDTSQSQRAPQQQQNTPSGAYPADISNPQNTPTVEDTTESKPA